MVKWLGKESDAGDEDQWTGAVSGEWRVAEEQKVKNERKQFSLDRNRVEEEKEKYKR